MAAHSLLSPTMESRNDIAEGFASDMKGYEATGRNTDVDEDDDGDEQEPMLPFQRGDVERLTAAAQTNGHYRPWWSSAIITIACVVTIFCMAWLVLSLDELGRPHPLDPSPLEVALAAPLRRQDKDYILDPGWDFGAPKQVRRHDWVIVDKEGDPDGVRKPMITMDGRFPGPLIEVNEGDIIEVDVHNLASNATAIHWHGIFQNGTNWMDGAARVTQCPIAPGASYRYKFNVTGQSGTYFYHGHQGVQALSGLVGPLVIHSRDEVAGQPIPYSSDRVVLLQDWYYDADSGLMRDFLSPGVEDAPMPNTALINGVNQAVCANSAGRACSTADRPLPTLELAPRASHRLRFLNVGASAWFQVAVDEHDSLPVVEVDGTAVEPAPGSALVIAPGQRYSAVLTADRSGNDAFWLRARMATSCFVGQDFPKESIDEAKAIVRYRTQTKRHGDDDHNEDDDDNENLPLPTTISKLPYLPTCRDMSSTTTFRPSPALPAPAYADHSWHLRVNLAIGDWRLQRGIVNGSSFRPNLQSPTLHRVLEGNASAFSRDGVLEDVFDAASELVISHAGAAETVDVVLQNMDENSHPFHLHGAQVWVLGAGHGYFPGYQALGLGAEGKGVLDNNNNNASVLANPLRRDTVTAEGFGWALLRFVADNPGAWLFHCHVAWHAEAGMGMVFLARPDVVRGWADGFPDDARRLCDAPEEELRKGASPRDDVFFGFGGDEEGG
ncbi:putative multicopper oxidase [Hypoxylon sp. FL1284]|nr:putative multicopper oxidase [Hypoxylon sp. FL1284]